MRAYLLRLAWAVALPLLLIGVYFGCLWGLGKFLPNALSFNVAAAVAAALLGLAQAEGLLRGSGSSSDAAGRLFLRLVVAAGWIISSSHASKHFLQKHAGGGIYRSMQDDVAAIRGALEYYHRLYPGTFPTKLEQFPLKDKVFVLPPAWHARSDYGRRFLPHPETPGIEVYGKEVCRGATNLRPVKAMLKDTGKWGYFNDPKSPCWGVIFIDCTHTDFDDRQWADF